MNFEFHGTHQVKEKLERSYPEKFTREQLRQIAEHVQFLEPKHLNRYFAELFVALGDDLVSLQQALNENRAAITEVDASARASLLEVRSTIEKFDQSSRRLTRWLVGLTGVLVILTIVIAGFTILLRRRG